MSGLGVFRDAEVVLVDVCRIGIFLEYALATRLRCRGACAHLLHLTQLRQNFRQVPIRQKSWLQFCWNRVSLIGESKMQLRVDRGQYPLSRKSWTAQ